jgi:hypothetical protein
MVDYKNIKIFNVQNPNEEFIEPNGQEQKRKI